MSTVPPRWAQRFTLRAELQLVSPLSIGGAQSSGLVDQLIVRDGMNRAIVPGTSLAGLLRAAVTHRPGGEGDGGGTGTTAGEWFGGADEGDSASRVIVEDAMIMSPAVSVRDGVGIDRVTGAAAAAASIKYNRQIVEPFATFTALVTVESAQPDGVPAVVEQLASVLSAGFQLGARTTTGMGRVELLPDGLTVTCRRFTSRDDTLRALSSGEPVELERLAATALPALTITVPWRPIAPVMVKAGLDGDAVDDLPLVTSAGDGDVQFVLPGSSLKGAFRSHAEWIMRTVLGRSESRPAEGPGDPFNQQLDVPLVRELFGAPASPEPGAAGGKGALTVFDSTCSRRIDREKWSAIEAAVRGSDPKDTSAPLAGTMAAIAAAGFTEGELEPAAHVAIDRWTSAPSAGALFSSLEIRLDHWSPVEFRIDMARLARRLDDPAHQRAALFLLMLTIRDFAEGLIPLGFGVNRGNGSVSAEMNEVEMEASGEHIAAGLASLVPDGGAASESLEEFEAAWLEYLGTKRKEAGS